ncbi:uncharacterized protein LOC119790045 isoform X2 [Cyprinodon tularosa]|uniref:uncharacterized protein LOC119790045 isoform X2 n=1 Tax=Cyprinodon tularosa TaxID=77115 RepID=UPI0018E1F7BC|nr:uncharacterized protein LOC119790045 isoform X2 [Cyprinodon tularosa]
MYLSLMLRGRQFEKGGRSEDDRCLHHKIEMWLKWVIVAFLTVAGAVLGMPMEQDIRLDDEVKKQHVNLGSSLTLRCCLNINKSQRFRVKYSFQSLKQSDTDNLTVEHCNLNNTLNANYTLMNGCQSACTLSNISKRNYGFYSCKVTSEIPVLTDFISNRTEIALENFMGNTTVQSETTKTQGISVASTEDNLWMWVLTGVSSFILILIMLLVVFLAQKRPCNRSTEEPIYVNTHTSSDKSPRLMSVDNVKKVSSQDLKTSSPARRYEERNRRYK